MSCQCDAMPKRKGDHHTKVCPSYRDFDMGLGHQEMARQLRAHGWVSKQIGHEPTYWRDPWKS